MSRVLTAATRGGDLAVAQTQIVISALQKVHPELEVRIRKVRTSGDRDRRTALWDLRSTGFFTTQVEDALLAGEADFAVHSLKDLPTVEREGLRIAAVCDRQYVEDCLVAREKIQRIEQLAAGERIGTSSLRRVMQLRRLRPELVPVPIRGNVRTRLRWAESGQVDAVILARAGLERLGLAGRISIVFDPAEFIPAAAQGALAVQTRLDDEATTELIAAIDEPVARTTTFAERRVLATMRCGCHAPVGVYATIAKQDIHIHAFICDLQGGNFIRRSAAGAVTEATKLAEGLAHELLAAGGAGIVADLERQRIGKED